MSRLSIRPYGGDGGSGDLEAFTPRADFAQEMQANLWRFRGGRRPPGVTWTLMRGDAVAGLGGVFDNGDGVFDAWAWLSEFAPRDWPDAVRLAARCLDFLERSRAVAEIRADARLDNPAAIRLLRRLGFREAGERHEAGRAYQHMTRSA